MITWAQLDGFMPASLGTVGGLVGSFLLFESQAQPTCFIGATSIPTTCLETPIGSFDVVEFGGLGMVVGAMVGFVIGLVVKSRAPQS